MPRVSSYPDIQLFGVLYVSGQTLTVFCTKAFSLPCEICGFKAGEPSMISASGVEGSLLRHEPSTILVFGVEGSLLRHEPSMIWVFGVEGSHLETEPSMKRGIGVEGSAVFY